MCGIAGFLTESKVEDGVLEAMVEAIRHRGPDSAGYFCDGPYRAGMRRLSINDLEGGRQPLSNEDGSVVLLYNGEIYNSPALRRELESKGHRFRTRSDGEVICHLYEESGENLFEKLDGMFAAALWIAKERKLILARDLPGEKPLYYAHTSNGGIAFASEIRSLRKYPRLDLSYDRQSLWDFPTFLWIPEPATIYTGVKALPRGHILVVDDKGTRISGYANRFNPEPLPLGSEGAVAETRRVVEAAVTSRLLSDVPVGAFLSGGLDSTIIATLARANLPELDTFTIGFEDVADAYHGRADEAAYAEETAEILGTRHHTLRVTSDTFRELLPLFCRHGDQPFAVSSGLGILAISRAARETGIKVLLSGDGADECFGGYSWYAHLAENSPPSPHMTGAHALGNVSFQNFGMSLESRLAVLRSYPAPMRAWAWHYYASEGEKGLFSEDFARSLEPSYRHFHAFKSSNDWSPEDFISQDRDFYFPQEMLRKLDRMTMAFSVEGRVPFAAPSVQAHAGKLRLRHMIGPAGLKHVLREAFADILPPGVLTRPKHGFNVPIDHWLKDDWNDLVEETFSPFSRLGKMGWLAPDSRIRAQAMLHDPSRLNGHTLFCYIMLEMWLQTAD